MPIALLISIKTQPRNMFKIGLIHARVNPPDGVRSHGIDKFKDLGNSCELKRRQESKDVRPIPMAGLVG